MQSNATRLGVVLAVFVVELNVETKKASGTMEMPKRKKEMKLTAKFVFVKNAVTPDVSGCNTPSAECAPNWKAAPDANMTRIEIAWSIHDVMNHESQNMLSCG